MATNPEANTTFSVFTLLDTLRRRKLFVILPTLLLGAGFWAYAHHQPDTYRTQAVIAAEHVTPPEYLKHVAPPPLNIQEHLFKVREVLYSTPVLEAAARQLPEYKNVEGPLPKEAIESLKSAIPIRVEGEHTFSISYEGADPQSIANVTNTVAAHFVDQASAKNEQRYTDTASVIDKELKANEVRTKELDERLRSYKQGIAQSLPEHVTENMREMDRLTQEYGARETKISDLEAARVSVKQQMSALDAKGALKNSVVREKTPAEVQLDALKLKEKEYLTRWKENHPDVVKLRDQIRTTEQMVANQVANIRTEPSPSYLEYVKLEAQLKEIDAKTAAYQKEQYATKDRIADYRGRVLSAPVHERKLDELTREMKVRESQLHALLDKQIDTSMGKGLEQSATGVAFSIVEPASVPTAPYSPQRERLILMGLVAGLGLGLAMAFLIEQNDSTFGTVDDFQAFTRMPMLGVIPTVPAARKLKKAGRNAIVTLSEPESVPAEQYRILAMKVQQICANSGTRVVMITSAAGGEGKSTTAINLAAALSPLADGPVLLVDADMRKPRLHEYLGTTTAPSGRGFHSLLTKPTDDLAQYTARLGDLSVILGSAPTPNPIAALASPKVRALFDRLKQQFKLIIVDAPPTLPIADSHILSGLCDKVLFVVRSRRTARELFQHAVESFDAANVVGAVLNDVEYQRSRYAYAYEYYRENYLARK